VFELKTKYIQTFAFLASKHAEDPINNYGHNSN
jgi:hypothetical protein